MTFYGVSESCQEEKLFSMMYAADVRCFSFVVFRHARIPVDLLLVIVLFLQYVIFHSRQNSKQNNRNLVRVMSSDTPCWRTRSPAFPNFKDKRTRKAMYVLYVLVLYVGTLCKYVKMLRGRPPRAILKPKYKGIEVLRGT